MLSYPRPGMALEKSNPLSLCVRVSLSSFSPQHRSHGSKGLLAPPYLTNNESPYRGIRSQPAALRSAGAADCHTTYYANGVSPRGRSFLIIIIGGGGSVDELGFLSSPPSPLITSSTIQVQLEMMHPSVHPSIHPCTPSHPSSKMMPLHTREREYPNFSLSLSFA